LEFPPVTKPYFSPVRGREVTWLLVCWITAAVSALILAFFWTQTRSLDFIISLQQWRSIILVEYFFKAFSFLGEDEFFMIFFGVLIWCIHKSLGFWTGIVLLTSAVYRGVLKDLTNLERPALAGVVHPEDSAFPSGHALTAVTVWGYLAVRVKKTGFWIWAIAAMVFVSLSRLVLGVHFLGDVLGGIALGLPFLLLFLWLSVQFLERGWMEKFTVPLLLLISVVLPIAITPVIPGVDSPKLLGLLAGASFGYIIEKEKVRSITATALPLQFVKAILGLAVLFGIIMGLSSVLPSGGPDAPFAAKMVGFARYALGGLWLTLGAPALFVALKLTPREPA
jgi:membrane-associated phospholipid phosphatase